MTKHFIEYLLTAALAGVAFQIQPARSLVVGRDQVEVRGVVLCLMQDVGELMMHRLEEPLIEEIYARAGRIQTVDVVQGDLQSALRGSKHDGSLVVEGLGADELDHPRAVCLYEGVAEQLVPSSAWPSPRPCHIQPGPGCSCCRTHGRCTCS